MKTMFDYTLHCTEEQVKKALKLGAPLQKYTSIPNFADVIEITMSEYYEIPTAEEMIGWLEEQDGIKEITICKTGMWIWGKKHTLIEGSPSYSSRQEATLAAIDAALSYLINNKK